VHNLRRLDDRHRTDAFSRCLHKQSQRSFADLPLFVVLIVIMIVSVALALHSSTRAASHGGLLEV